MTLSRPMRLIERRRTAPAVKQIVLDREVGKQARLLEDVADVPLFRRKIDPPFGIEQHLAVENDAAGFGVQQPGNGVDHRRLAATGRTEQAR